MWWDQRPCGCFSCCWDGVRWAGCADPKSPILRVIQDGPGGHWAVSEYTFNNEWRFIQETWGLLAAAFQMSEDKTKKRRPMLRQNQQYGLRNRVEVATSIWGRLRNVVFCKILSEIEIISCIFPPIFQAFTWTTAIRKERVMPSQSDSSYWAPKPAACCNKLNLRTTWKNNPGWWDSSIIILVNSMRIAFFHKTG